MSLDLDRSAWTRVKFGDVVRNVNDNVKDPDTAGITRVIGLEHLDPGKLRVERWGDLSDETTFTRRVRPGQTLFGKRRAYQRKTAYAEFEAVCSGDILVFESADPTKLLPELLPFIAMTDGFYGKALETSAGSLSPRTRWTDLAKYEFDLPPLDQQRRIADLLWALESHADQVSKTVELADELRSGLASEVCYRSGRMKKLVEVLDVVRGGSPRPIQNFVTESDDGINWIKIGDVEAGGKYITQTAERIKPSGLSKTRRVGPGALLLSNSMSFGRPYIVTIDGCIHDGWLALTDSSDMWRTEYLYYLLRSRQVQAQFVRAAAGSTVKNLNIDIVSSVNIPLATLEEQDAALLQFGALEEVIANTAAERERLAALRRGILDGIVDGGEK